MSSGKFFWEGNDANSFRDSGHSCGLARADHGLFSEADSLRRQHWGRGEVELGCADLPKDVALSKLANLIALALFDFRLVPLRVA